jgi:DHA1 family tetracycline resistance protein-like MFS transporter
MKRGSFPVLFTLYLVVFLDALCVGIALPVMSYLLLENSSSFSYLSLDMRYFLLGLILALAPLAQFFGAPLFGAISDHIGRKKVFVLSLIGGIIGYVLFALGVIFLSLPLLIIGRILDGIAGGNYSLALAAVSDFSRKKTQTKNFSRIAIAFGAGIVFGPIVGSKLADPSLVSFFTEATPFWFAAILLSLNLLFVLFFFRETEKRRATTRVTALTGLTNLVHAFRIQYTRSLFLIIFLFNFANLLFVYFFQAILITLFKLTPSVVGNLLVYYVLCLVVTQLMLTPYFSRKISPVRLLHFTLLLLAASTLAFSFIPYSFLFFIILFLVAALQGITYTNLLVLISTSSSEESRGEIFGINQSVEAFANILSLLFAGILAGLFPLLPVWVAAGLFAIGWGIVVLCVRRPSFHIFKEI